MLKELKTGWNTHFSQGKNVKTEFFSAAIPLESEGRQRGLQCHRQTPNLESSRISLARFNFKNSRLNYFFLFRPLKSCKFTEHLQERHGRGTILFKFNHKNTYTTLMTPFLFKVFNMYISGEIFLGYSIKHDFNVKFCQTWQLSPHKPQ